MYFFAARSLTIISPIKKENKKKVYPPSTSVVQPLANGSSAQPQQVGEAGKRLEGEK